MSSCYLATNETTLGQFNHQDSNHRLTKQKRILPEPECFCGYCSQIMSKWATDDHSLHDSYIYIKTRNVRAWTEINFQVTCENFVYKR